jgi:hypothetical protein
VTCTSLIGTGDAHFFNRTKFQRRNACIVTSFAAGGHYQFEFLSVFNPWFSGKRRHARPAVLCRLSLYCSPPNLPAREDKIMIRKILVITLSLSLLASQAAAQQAPSGTKPRKLKLHRHTGLKFNLVQPLSSATAKPGDEVSLKLANPLVIDGITILQAGEVFNAKVVKVKKARSSCKNGNVEWKLDHLAMPDSTLVKASINFATPCPDAKVPDRFSPWKDALGVDNWWEAILLVPEYALIAIVYAPLLALAPIGLLALAGNGCDVPGNEFQLPAGSTVGVEIRENHTVHY